MKKILLILSIAGALVLIQPKSFANTAKINGPDIIYKQASSVLLMSDILEMYDYQGEAVNLVLDEYTGNGNVPGIYDFKLQHGSITSTKKIEVKNLLHEKIIAASKTGEEYMIHVNKEEKLTDQDIVKIMERIGLYNLISNDVVMKVSDTYTENWNSPGIYVFEIQVVNSNGNSNNYHTKVLISHDSKISMDVTPIDMGNNSSSNTSLIIMGVIALLGIGLLVFKGGGKK